MPYVLLEEIGSGQQIWFANFHNAADVRGQAQKWRDSATAMEADLANRLGADGTPVIMTGDFNERERFFCGLTSRAPSMKSASGATGGPPCVVPRGAQIDWILGSAPVRFDKYQVLDGGLINQMTDHPVIIADATFAQR
jgi:endonuclease/exonuclease/phosphatase family metal-dependent hydrolase